MKKIDLFTTGCSGEVLVLAVPFFSAVALERLAVCNQSPFGIKADVVPFFLDWLATSSGQWRLAFSAGNSLVREND